MIIAVAIRDLNQDYELSMPCPNRHHHVIREMAYRGHDGAHLCEQGFIDDQCGFVNRIEAAQIALDQGQIKSLRWPPNLFSEELW